MTRRLRIFAALMLVFVLLPLVFDVGGEAVSRAAKGGIVGVAVACIAISLLVQRPLSIGRISYSYGNGFALRLQELGLAIGGVVASIAVLAVVVLVSR